MDYGVELRRLDDQGRLILPPDWRREEVSESKEVYVIKRKGALKIIPRKKIDLAKWFDSLDLGVDTIGDWSNFEKRFYGESK